MTDKELRKLSRLELLEMLLDVSKENEALKQTIEKKDEELRLCKNIDSLSTATTQINNALEHINSITGNLTKAAPVIASPAHTVENKHIPESGNEPKAITSDGELYCRLIAHYAKDDNSLSLLPDDIQTKVRNRIREILESRNK